MESLALLVALIVIGLSVLSFIGGFILADMSSSLVMMFIGLLGPVGIIVWVTGQIPLALFWICFYIAGYLLGAWFRGKYATRKS